MKRHKKAKKILLIILIVPVVVALVGFVVMSLWNWLIPTLFNGPVLTFWQALGLLLLSKILFGGFKGKKHHHGGKGRMNPWRQRFESMTPEEKEAFKAKWAHRWGCQSPGEPGNVEEEKSPE